MKKFLVSTAGAIAGLAVMFAALSAIDGVSDVSAKTRKHVHRQVERVIGWAQEFGLPWPATYNTQPTPDHCMMDDGYGRHSPCSGFGGGGS